MKFKDPKKVNSNKLGRIFDRSAKIAYRLPVLWQLVDAKLKKKEMPLMRNLRKGCRS